MGENKIVEELMNFSQQASVPDPAPPDFLLFSPVFPQLPGGSGGAAGVPGGQQGAGGRAGSPAESGRAPHEGPAV